MLSSVMTGDCRLCRDKPSKNLILKPYPYYLFSWRWSYLRKEVSPRKEVGLERRHSAFSNSYVMSYYIIIAVMISVNSLEVSPRLIEAMLLV